MTKLNNKKIENLLINYQNTPMVEPTSSIYNSISQMSNTGIGIICVVKNKKLKGIITDGDLRRIIISWNKPLPAFLSENVEKYMNKNPLTISKNFTLDRVIKLMERKKIWDLPVLDAQLNLIGLCHLHKVLKVLLNND